MLRRFMPFLCLLAAVPARAEEHNCLDHHWVGIDYHRELRWQLAAFALLFLVYGLSKGFKWLKKRAA